jgi:adenylyltransferase and sulfurtransferase
MQPQQPMISPQHRTADDRMRQRILQLKAKIRELELEVIQLEGGGDDENGIWMREQQEKLDSNGGDRSGNEEGAADGDRNNSTPAETAERSSSQQPDLPPNKERERQASEDPTAATPAAAAATSTTSTRSSVPAGVGPPSEPPKLSNDEIFRYSRHLLLSDGYGVRGQLHLIHRCSVLVIGAGGIASTLLPYLATAGVGCLGIVDGDVVELSNLHRQFVLHDAPAPAAAAAPKNKAASAKQTLHRLNPTLKRVTAYQYHLTAANALALVSQYDCIVDASDNPQTRYLVNDACVLAGKPLVSGSAVGTQGQLTVYNYPPRHLPANEQLRQQQQRSKPGGASDGGIDRSTSTCPPFGCYRCLYPNPATSSSGSQSCSDAGVLGPVPGLIGILQAIETLKVLLSSSSIKEDENDGVKKDSEKTEWNTNVMYDRLLMYDALDCSFLNVRKPPRRTDCSVCGDHPTITSMEESLDSLQDTRGPACTRNMATTKTASGSVGTEDDDENGITCQEYHSEIVQLKIPHILLDVRVPQQFDMCALPHAVNVPLETLLGGGDSSSGTAALASMPVELSSSSDTRPIYCICRRGVASVHAVRILRSRLKDSSRKVFNVRGGLVAWQKQVDSSFPSY